MFVKKIITAALVILPWVVQAESDQVALIVGEQITTLSEFKAREQFLQAYFSEKGMTLTRSDLIQYLVDRQLQMARAKQLDMNVAEEEIAMARKALFQQRSVKTQEELEAQLQSKGMDVELFQQQFVGDILLEKLQYTDAKMLSAKDATAWQSFYDQVKSHHQQVRFIDVHIASQKISESQVRKFVGQWQKAPQFIPSEPKNAYKVYRKSWQALSDQPEIFQQVLSQLSEGQVSQAILTGNGWHILQLKGKRLAKSMPSQADLKETFEQKQFEANIGRWIENLRKSYEVKIMDVVYYSR